MEMYVGLEEQAGSPMERVGGKKAYLPLILSLASEVGICLSTAYTLYKPTAILGEACYIISIS